jgi:hypothetical protein
MICELNPLKTLIVVHVNLSEKVNEIADHFMVGLGVVFLA